MRAFSVWIAPHQQFTERTPSFSPDGNWLIMSSDVASDAPALYGMPAKELAQGARPLWPLTLTGGVRDAVWIKR